MSGAAELDPEDAKIVTLARSARARTGAAEGAAVRDTDGRTYAAATVALPSLSLTALQAAVAAAVSSGAPGLEAAAVVTAADGVDDGLAGRRPRPRAGRPGAARRRDRRRPRRAGARRPHDRPPATTSSSSAAASSASPRRTRCARTGRSVAVVEREPRLAAHQTGQQLQRHPLRAVLRARAATRPASPSPAAPRPSRSAARTTCRTRSPASSSSPPSPTSCRGSPSSSGAATRTASRTTSWTRPGCASTSRTSAGIARAVRAVHRDHRLPGDRREARRAGGEGRRRDPPRARGPQRRARAAPTSWSAPTAATCSAPRSWSAPACAATSWPGPPAPTPACGSSRSAASTPGLGERAAGPGQGPDLPGARPGVPVPRRARHARGSTAASTPARTPCSRWPARATRGAPCEPRSCSGRWPYPGMLRLARQHWRYGLGEMHRSLSRDGDGPPDPADAARRPRRRPASGRRRGARPGGAARRHAGRRLPVRRTGRPGAGAVLHVLNAPSPAATAALPIGREILETLTGEKLGPL